MVPVAHGNDGGGSIRIPSSCCGLFGLKPTRGRNPLGPDYGDIMSGLVAEHVLTRSVRDSAALLDATAGPDVGDPYWAPPPARPFRAEVGTAPGRLRIAFSVHAASGVPVHADCVSAVEDAAALCAALGHDVEDAAPAFDNVALTARSSSIYAAEAAQNLATIERVTGWKPTRESFEPLTWALHEMGASLSAADYLTAVQDLQGLARVVARFFVDHDVWLTPVLAEPPLPLGALDAPPGNPLGGFFRAAEWCPFTPLCNATGQPAMSVPLFWNVAGLPIGSHFVGASATRRRSSGWRRSSRRRGRGLGVGHRSRLSHATGLLPAGNEARVMWRGHNRWTIRGDKTIAIIRDAHGVPHVQASSEPDLYRGLGYCHGVDRALQMLVVAHLGAGARLGVPRRQ